MSEFRTVVSISQSSNKIGFKTPVLTIGSCFSDAIGQRLNAAKIPSMVNPLGTIYNPVSIHKTITTAILGNEPASAGFVQSHGFFHHFDYHSSFANVNAEALRHDIRSCMMDVHSFLSSTEWLLITYGTAWIYTHKASGEIVANCHKIPAKEFERSLFSVQQIKDSFRDMMKTLVQKIESCRVIVTVSPVRHTRDTLELNAVSKSILRTACHELTQEFQNVEYFPAFEIMMDDLRDYRFYKTDMIHPNETAENYIWEKFAERYFTDDTRTTMQHLDKLQKALAHRPFHPGSENHRNFLSDTLKKFEALASVVNVEEEIQTIRAALTRISS